MTVTVAAPAGPFIHPALFYSSDEEYLAGLVPFITEGLARQEPVAVAAPESRLRLLRDALDGVAEQVTMLNMAEAGRNPGRIIARVLLRFAGAHPEGHVRIVGEPIWAGRTETEYPACVQHEALINAAFGGRDVTIVCPYDVSGLEEFAIADARATHPLLWEAGRSYSSDRYDPDAVVARYNLPLRNSTEVGLSVTSATDLPAVRKHAVEQAERFGLDAEHFPDLELIATELVVNSLVHADGNCLLRVWSEADQLICEVRDTGQLTDPLAGRRPEQPGQLGGRGLLLVNDLADLVRIHTSPNGTTIRAFLRLDRNTA